VSIEARHNTTLLPKQLARPLTVQFFRISEEAPTSLVKVLRGFIQLVEANFWVVLQIELRSFPSTSLQSVPVIIEINAIGLLSELLTLQNHK
jgi:hypothetical protein